MMATIHEINKEWQHEGMLPTWAKLQKAQDEFDALQKQMESQKDEWLSWQAKRKELEKDAARYQWLRERVKFWRTSDGNGAVVWFNVTNVPASSSPQDETDAAIDWSIFKEE